MRPTDATAQEGTRRITPAESPRDRLPKTSLPSATPSPSVPSQSAAPGQSTAAPTPGRTPDRSAMLNCPEAAGIKTGVMRPLDVQELRRSSVPRAVWGITLGEASHGGGGKSRYDLSSPLAAAAWRRLGYEPLVIVVADNEKHADQLRASGSSDVHSLQELSAMSVEVHVTAPAPGKSPGQTGQLVRMAAVGTEWLWNSDTVITTDADMIPLSMPFFQAGKRGTMTVFNHGILSNQFAMCYLQSPARLWRDILRMPGDKPQQSFASAVNAAFGATGAGGWATDQQTVTDLINKWPEWSAQGHTVPVASWSGWRLDRGRSFRDFFDDVRRWEQCKAPGVDFHMQYLRPGDCEGDASKAIDAVISRLFDSVDLGLLRDYVRRATCGE
ncbi:hypothetical protein FNF28_07857 [Cafeteria roenbergensis]|uniref:Uncharacterized protein n=1 Tax=Cafeteria roenbergensis TaxID=33653 RepID=A0A5A8BY33_CAFRO|nr:hypothetical protein FNF28_07857 [Cafeteria roenbergensis]